MILSRKFYSKISFWKSLWVSRKMRDLRGVKVFRTLKIHKTEWPQKLYFYSPRLKLVPRFTGNVGLLREWKDAKKSEAICPTRAIEVTESDYRIDPRGCIACGLCLEIAPEGILEVGEKEALSFERASKN